MDVNADFTQRVSVHAARLDWAPSPIPGVERRVLDRIGTEVARATSIVRYAPQSRFSPHIHGGGEEILVLEGVFQDEHGDFPAGSYLRNPPTSRHTPGSAPGCIIFVKLWQFDAADRTPVRIDTNKMAFLAASDRPGVAIMPLFLDGRENVRIERYAPGADIDFSAEGGTELLVLDGSFGAGNEKFELQSWLRLPPGARLTCQAGASGAKLWVKSGHLARVQTAPQQYGAGIQRNTLSK